LVVVLNGRLDVCEKHHPQIIVLQKILTQTCTILFDEVDVCLKAWQDIGNVGISRLPSIHTLCILSFLSVVILLHIDDLNMLVRASSGRFLLLILCSLKLI
jgi:hypothetical protein